MLSVLRIKNLAIIESSEIELGSGLNVLTGETGAGKSIILKAIELLTGKRASSDLVRSGAERCEVEGLFYLSPEAQSEIAESLPGAEEFLEGEELLIKRTVESTGRSKVYLNGSLGTTNILQNLSPFIIDITGQHQHQTLLDGASQRNVLDTFAKHDDLLASVANAYSRYSEAEIRLKRIEESSSAIFERLTRLRQEFDELSEAALTTGERELLEQELVRHENTEELGMLVQSALRSFDDEGGVSDVLRSLSSQVAQVVRLDESMKESETLLDSAEVHLNEVQSSLEEYLSKLEADPQRLEEIRARIAEIARLERKFGKAESALVDYTREIGDEIAEFDSGSLDLDTLRKEVHTLREALSGEEARLSESRKAAAVKIAKAVDKDLVSLDMKRARFSVSIKAGPSSKHGADLISFQLAANPGEPAKALSKVASGGELSRVLLILKTILNRRTGASTQIFDEIDTGVSGAVAHSVGEKLLKVAKNAQVVLITHSPQIAALADTHFLVKKSTSKKSTFSSVEQLDDQRRVETLSKMLAGKRTSANFEQSARELLKARSGA